MISEAEKKTQEQVKIVLLDWKGCGNSEQRNKLKELLDDLNFKSKRVKGYENNQRKV